jgi:PAS domain S-box-containing protein
VLHSFSSIAEEYFKENPDALVAVDCNGFCVAVNTAAEKLFRSGFGREISPGMSFRDIISIDDYPEFSLALDAVMGGGSSVPIVSILKSQNGEEVWYESVLTPVGAADGSPVVLSVMEITEKKKTIDKLFESERRFKALVQNSAGVIILTDDRGIVKWVSESVYKFLGYRTHDFRKRDLSLFIHGKDISSFHVLLANLHGTENVVYTSEIQFLDRNGNVLCFQVSGSNHLKNPSVEGIIFNAHDVTERRHLDQIMLRLARQNELILETASEGIFGLNKNGILTFINPYAALILGYKPEECVGSHYSVLLSPLTPLEANALARRIESVETVYGEETSLSRKDGVLLPVEFSSTPVREGERITGTVVTFSDITHRIEIEEQLRRAKDDAESANRAKSDFLASMSHEIRTPMNSVLGFIEMLSLTDLSDVQNDYLSTASSNAQHLLDLINDILDISKIEKGKLEMESVSFVPSDALASAVSFFQTQAAAKKVSLSQSIAVTPCCKGDPLRFRQVAANLIGNAVKFTPEGGVVEIGLTFFTESGVCNAEISVRDTGIGIFPDRLSAIFDPFSQADASIARNYGGSGLGLSISRQLVSMMGGALQAESEPGKGSRFFFTVPLIISHEAVVKNTIESSQSFPPGLRALVAEDTADSRKLLSLMLKRLGIECDTVENGQQAFDRTGVERYDILFMDGNMPVCDGFEATRMIRKREELHSGPRLPIVALTARAVTGDREMFLAAGMNDYVTKPVSLETLCRAVSRTLAVSTVRAPGEYGSPEKKLLPDFDKTALSLGITRDDYVMLSGEFLRSFEKHCAELEAAVEKNALHSVELISHRMKGSAMNFRFPDLAALCAAMELSAKERQAADYSAMVLEIRRQGILLEEAFSLAIGR